MTHPRSVSAFEWPSASQAAPQLTSAPLALYASAPAAPAEASEGSAFTERDAFAQGYAQGERAGAEAAATRGDAMLRRLTQTLEELTALRSEMIHHTEQQMVQLALAVARRIIHREVSLDQDLLIAMARVALDRLGESATVTVRLHPDDYAATVGPRAASWNGTNVTVAGDARVGRGGCRIESEFGTLDAGVDAQIQELARALLGEDASVVGVPEVVIA